MFRFNESLTLVETVGNIFKEILNCLYFYCIIWKETYLRIPKSTELSSVFDCKF